MSEPDPVISRRHRRSEGNLTGLATLLGLIGTIGLVLSAACGVVGWRSLKPAGQNTESSALTTTGPGLLGPSASSEGEKWSHPELLAYLNQKGLGLVMHATHRGAFHGPAAYFTPPSVDVFDGEPTDDSQSLYVQIRPTSQSAKDDAGLRQQSAFSWGRFVFVTSNPSLRANVKKALGIT